MASTGDRMKRDTLLGLVFFGGLGLLLWATLNLTDLSFGDQRRLDVYFPSGIDLQQGDPVMILGTRVGKVEAVTIEPDAATAPTHRVRVSMSLTTDVALTENASFEIQDATLLGGKKVEIDPGFDGGALDEDKPLRGQSVGNPLASVGETFSDPDNKENLGAILREIRQLVENVNSGRGSLGRVISEDDLYVELLAAVQSLRQSAEAIEQAQGALGRIIHDTQLGDDLTQLIANLRTLSDRATTGDNLVARLLNDRTWSDALDEMLTDARDIINRINDGEGTIGALVGDQQLADDLKAAVAQIRRLAELAGDPQAGLLGAIFADPQLADEVRAIVADVGTFANSLVEGRGLLGVLIEDEDIAEQFSRLLRQVARAVEDAREAAPVGTFVQAIIGAF